MPIQNVFATPIYSDRLLKDSRASKRFARELEEQCQLVRETDPEGEEWSRTHYPLGYTSYGSIDDLHARYPHFEELARSCDRHVQRLARRIGMDLQGGRLSMSSCWVNIMPTWTTHSLHLHPLSVISGTYYVAIPKGASSIKFEDPRLPLYMAAPPKLPTAKSQPFLSYEPKVGDLILWESWLRHEVPPNPSPGERISISFNYDWVR